MNYNLREIVELIENKSLCHFREFNENGITVDEYFSPLIGFKIDPETGEGLFVSNEGTEWTHYEKANEKEVHQFLIDLRLYYPDGVINVDDLREYITEAVSNTPNIVLDTVRVEEIKNEENPSK